MSEVDHDNYPQAGKNRLPHLENGKEINNQMGKADHDGKARNLRLRNQRSGAKVRRPRNGLVHEADLKPDDNRDSP